jgi:hypothetical protein
VPYIEWALRNEYKQPSLLRRSDILLSCKHAFPASRE